MDFAPKTMAIQPIFLPEILLTPSEWVTPITMKDYCEGKWDTNKEKEIENKPMYRPTANVFQSSLHRRNHGG